VLVHASFEESHHRYGSPRIHADLIDQAVPVSRKRVVRLMQEEGLQARPRKRFTCTTMSDHDHPVAANLLNRQFTAERPNQRWVGDTTEFLIGDRGKLYLAAILDLFSRFTVGWAVSAVYDRHLTIKALEHGAEAPRSRQRVVASFRPGAFVRERGLPDDSRRARHHLQHESPRRLLRHTR
jgi:transposase InsO family protein